MGWHATALLAAALAALPAAGQPLGTADDTRPLVLLVGDSTLASRTGYGDALCQRLEPAVRCLNLARGGRSSHSYRAEGLWQQALDRLRAGKPGLTHHVLVQFGHNDQPGKPGRSTDLATEFPANLAGYVGDVRAAGGLPVLLTPLTRRSFGDGPGGPLLQRGLQPWADATLAVARALQVPLIDLHGLSADLVQALGPQAADQLAEAPPGSPRFDRTHLGPRGACVFAALVAQELARLVPALAVQTAGPDCSALGWP